jgi:phosphoribosylglycinamide formyltransferase 1
MKVIILTGSELRHEYFRRSFAMQEGIQVLASFCEGRENNVQSIIDKEEQAPLRKKHLAAREKSEREFFSNFLNSSPDRSKPTFLPRGDINKPEVTEAITKAAPDFLVAYGCSLIREPLLSAFSGRFFNVHLGLSPYYRGSGTNYWALVNGEPECVGATFMHIDAGVDTGEIIHQIRARVEKGDTPHMIGNRLIAGMTGSYARLVKMGSKLKKLPQIPLRPSDRVYRKKDFTEESVALLYKRFREGLVDDYLANLKERQSRYPILAQAGV